MISSERGEAGLGGEVVPPPERQQRRVNPRQGLRRAWGFFLGEGRDRAGNGSELEAGGLV